MALNHGFLHQFTQEPSLATQIGSPSLESSLQGTEAPTNELSFKSVKYTDPEAMDQFDLAAYNDMFSELQEGLEGLFPSQLRAADVFDEFETELEGIITSWDGNTAGQG